MPLARRKLTLELASPDWHCAKGDGAAIVGSGMDRRGSSGMRLTRAGKSALEGVVPIRSCLDKMVLPDPSLSAEGLLEILRAVVGQRTADFSGIGLVVCDSPEQLPLVPLSNVPEQRDAKDLVRRLIAIASHSSAHHDGFHILSSDWELIRVAQYFSPPIAAHAQIDRSKRFGGRYLAALFGSVMPGVIASGIASEGFGIAVFRSATEVIFEDLG